MKTESGRNRIVRPAGIELTMAAEERLQLNADSRVLSLGSGGGDLECYLVSKYKLDLTGVDNDEAEVKLANELAASQGLSSNARFFMGDAAWLDFPAETFDLVFACGSLLGFFDRGVEETARVLKKGGSAVMIDLVPVCADIPRNFIDYWNERGVRILYPETIEQEFSRRGMETAFRKVYHDPLWWEIYFRNQQASPLTLQIQTYRECAGVMLGIFRKSGD
jgi:ubiquinone/menaquinone biosynthesis C-methylase UbiE